MGGFHQEISTMYSVFKSNDYPKNFVKFCIKNFLDKLFVKKKVNLTVPTLQIVCLMPYTGKCFIDL